MTSTVAGAAVRRYLPQLIGYPCLSAIAIPTTLAEAPIGVEFPPISVPSARVQAKTGKGIADSAERLAITGTMVAAKGILSTTPEATADTHRIMGITINIFPPDTSPM